jgi:hypothetical protein
LNSLSRDFFSRLELFAGCVSFLKNKKNTTTMTEAGTNMTVGEDEENQSTFEKFSSKFADGVCGVLCVSTIHFISLSRSPLALP